MPDASASIGTFPNQLPSSKRGIDMATYHSPITYRVDRTIGWRLVASGLWLRLGFVGACATAVSVILMFTGETGPLVALATAVLGGALAAFAWRRALSVLEPVETSAVAGVSTVQPVRRTDGDRLSLSLSPLHH
jgi:hypothetical protein